MTEYLSSILTLHNANGTTQQYLIDQDVTRHHPDSHYQGTGNPSVIQEAK
jgi:hypothetical protein